MSRLLHGKMGTRRWGGRQAERNLNTGEDNMLTFQYQACVCVCACETLFAFGEARVNISSPLRSTFNDDSQGWNEHFEASLKQQFVPENKTFLICLRLWNKPSQFTPTALCSPVVATNFKELWAHVQKQNTKTTLKPWSYTGSAN